MNYRALKNNVNRKISRWWWKNDTYQSLHTLQRFHKDVILGHALGRDGQSEKKIAFGWQYCEERKIYLQERNYRGKTLWHECDKNGDRESDTTSRLAFIRGGDTDDEEDYGEDDGDCWNHHHKLATVVLSVDCIRTCPFPASNTYISIASGLWLPVSPPVSLAIWPGQIVSR